MAALRKNLPDYYEALEIKEDADEATIKKAYRRLVLKWHPDRNPADRPLAEEKIRLLNTAYETVTNPIKRETYDLQRAALSRKRKGQSAKPRSAPRVGVPKEFMMTPLGYPECFVRSLGRRVVVHSRSDDPDADFKTFFSGTKLALWWLPEVNNMCRIRGLGSKARGDKKGAAAGRAGGLNLAFDPQKAKTSGAAGSEVRMAPANKGQKADSVNFVTKASPTCEGGLRFESASQRGQYLAFFPPSHLRVVPFLEDAEDRVLDFMFVDFGSMFKFINIEEVLLPVFSAEEAGAWLSVSKLQEDENVKKHFQEVMGKAVWNTEDFQAFFEGHWTSYEYKAEEKQVRLRPKHERLAKQLRATPKVDEVVAAVAKSEEQELKRLPVGALARALSSLAAASNGAAGSKERSGEEQTQAQIRLLKALRAAGGEEEEGNYDIPAKELLESAEQVLELGGDDPNDTVLVQRTAAARILAGKALQVGSDGEGGLQQAGYLVGDVVRFLHLPGAAGRDTLLSTACAKLLGEGSLLQQQEVLRTAAARGSTNTAAAAGTAILRTLTGGGSPTNHVAASDDYVEAVKEVAQSGVRLPAAAALLRRMASSAKPSKLADALLVLSQRAGPGQAEDMQATAECLASKGSFGELSDETLLQLALASSKSEALESLVQPLATAAASRLASWPGGDAVKLLLALARRRALLAAEAREALRLAADAALTPSLGDLSADDLAGLVLATLGHGWASLQEAASEQLLHRLPKFPPKPLLLVTPALVQAKWSVDKLIGAWPKVLAHCDAASSSASASAEAPSGETGLSPDQLVKLAHIGKNQASASSGSQGVAPEEWQELFEAVGTRILPQVPELSASGRAQLSTQLSGKWGLGSCSKQATLKKAMAVGVLEATAASETAKSSRKSALTATGPLSKKQKGTQLRKKLKRQGR